jgi:hypothetical protein
VLGREAEVESLACEVDKDLVSVSSVQGLNANSFVLCNLLSAIGIKVRQENTLKSFVSRGVVRIFGQGGGSKSPGGAQRRGQAASDSRRKVRARHSVQCWVKLIVDTCDFSPSPR